jgi:hypothetical protein
VRLEGNNKRWEGPPTWRDEPSGRVKGTEGKGLQEKGASAEKLESWMRRPVQPESAMSGEDGRRADTAPNEEGGDVVIGMGGED